MITAAHDETGEVGSSRLCTEDHDKKRNDRIKDESSQTFPQPGAQASHHRMISQADSVGPKAGAPKYPTGTY